MKNNLKKKSIIIIGLLIAIFVLYFIFFSGREAVAPIPDKATPAVPESSSSSVEVLKPNSIHFIPEQIPTSSPNVVSPIRVSSSSVIASSTYIASSSAIASSTIKAIATTSVNTEKPNIINITVPFTPQAPLANWKDERQEDGCEEAVSLMAMAWVNGAKEKLTAAAWEKSIIELSDFEQEKYGEYRDVTLADMITWIFNDYFKYEGVSIKTVASSTDILSELEKGNIVLAPMNGQKLRNPYFTAPGPLTHMIVIKGYDYKTKEFITNDPGTKRGENYHYSESIILGAINVYPTGYHEEVASINKAIIVVEK